MATPSSTTQKQTEKRTMKRQLCNSSNDGPDERRKRSRSSSSAADEDRHETMNGEHATTTPDEGEEQKPDLQSVSLNGSSLEVSPKTERALIAFCKEGALLGEDELAQGIDNNSTTTTISRVLQQDKSDQDSRQYIHQQGEYDEGMRVFTAALPVDNQVNQSTKSISLFYNVGLSHFSRGQHMQARRWFELALERMDKATNDEKDTMTLLYLHHNLGNCNYHLGQNEKAMAEYRQALEIVRYHNLGTNHEAACLNCIAVLLFHGGLTKPGQVLGLFEHTLAVYRSIKGDKSREVATILNNIGRIYYLESKYKEALEVYAEALEIRKELLGQDSIDVAATICNTGQTYHQLGELDKAMECYQNFLSLASNLLTSKHRDIAIIYKCMGEIYHEKKDLEHARGMYEKALTIGKTALGSHHPELASTLNKLGNLYFEMGDLDTALRYYNEGLKVEQQSLEKGHPHTIITLMNVAQIHRQRGNFASALSTYVQVHSLQVESCGPNSLEAANAMSNIALMEYQMESFDSSFESFQEALRIQRDSYGSDDHLEIAATLNLIGLVLFGKKVYELAKGCFRDSLRIRQKLLGVDHREVGIVWYNIASTYLETGDDDQAIKYYKETLRVERLNLGGKHQDVLLTLQHLGLVHQQRGELDLGLKYFTKALEIERQRSREDATATSSHIAVGKLLNLIGNIHLQQANIADMMECYSEASRIYRDWAQPNDTLVIAGYNFYGLAKLHPPNASIA
mmetsp:Transcript_26222/g.72356  ORF Transcript_26222/g.72356 Transcript_26222/m.72356 type:complete len:741 (-) Transcript_26222:95-2317(-)